MTNALVPREASSKMVEVGYHPDTYEQMLAASPNAGKVSREKLEEVAEHIQQRSSFSVHNPSQLAREAIAILGLEIEESE